MPKKTTRKTFIKQLSILPASLLLPQWGLSSVLKIADAQNKQVDPMTALMVTKTALDLISSFSGSKDSPMAAMLQYQNQMLELISSQLDDIQQSLVNVQNAIEDLPTQFEDILKVQYQSELIAEVRGAAYRYDHIYLRPARENPDIIKNEEVKNEIRDILNIVDQKLSTLRNLKGGLSPEACMIAPIALSLEVAARTTLGMPTAIIKSTLLKYKEWFREMTGDKSGAIPDIQAQTIKEHNKILDDAMNIPLAKWYELNKHKIGGSQKSAYCNDPVIIFTKLPVTGLEIPARQASTKVQNLKPFTHGVYARTARLENKMNEQFQVNFIEFSEPLIMIASTKPQVNFAYPKDGRVCYIYHGAPNTASREKLEEIAESSGKKWSDHNAMRAKMSKAMLEANLQRVKLSFCSYGYTIANNTTQRIEEYLKLI